MTSVHIQAQLSDIVQNCDTLWTTEFEQQVLEILLNNNVGIKKSRQEYHIKNTYAVANLAGLQKVITQKNGKYMATKENVITIVRDIHLSTGHKGEKKTHKKILETYANIPRRIVTEFIKQCERCTEKLKRKETTNGIVIRPITVDDLNQRGQVDLVDFQSLSDGHFKFIMHYQEHLTKFHLLRALVTKSAKEVAQHLLDIFLEYGAPHVLQSDNGREFTADIIKELSSLWPGLVLVNGRPRYPQSQGSVERSNATLKDSLVAWMRDNDTSAWSIGIKFVQWNLNTTYHETIKMQPYQALFGVKPKMGLGTNLPIEFLQKIKSGVDEDVLENILRDNATITTDIPPLEAIGINTVTEDGNVDNELIVEEQLINANEEIQPEIGNIDGITGHLNNYVIVCQELNYNVENSREGMSVVNETDGNEVEPHPAIMLREVASENMKSAAKKMIERTNKKLNPVTISSCVNVFVPAFDRGRGDPANLTGVVLDIKDGRYKIGTKGGIIENWLERNSFESIDYQGLSDIDVPSTEMSIRALVRALSVGTGQGFKKCSCKSRCDNKRCSCVKSNFLCNSSCHPNRSCDNH